MKVLTSALVIGFLSGVIADSKAVTLPPAPAGMKWQKVEILSDEFDGTELDSTKWHDYHPNWSGRPPSKFKQGNAYVEDGNLCLKSGLMKDPSTVADPFEDIWVDAAACVSKEKSAKVGYYYEASMKASNLSMTSSFWFRVGKYSEIDVIEHIGNPSRDNRDDDLPYEYHANTHVYGTQSGKSVGKGWEMPTRGRDEYHLYGFWWKDANTLWFYHNNEKVMEITPSVPFEENLKMVFDTEVFPFASAGVANIGLPLVENLNDDSKNTMYVDYVHTFELVEDPDAVGPYTGTPIAVPGVVEAENYDKGGEGLAYHDTEELNKLGEYRTDGVDIQVCTDTGGGYNLGYVTAGEWLNYTISADEDGRFDLAVRAASLSAGGSFRIKIDGVDVTGLKTIPVTGGWQTYADVVIQDIAVAAGEHVLQFYSESAGYNLNSIKVTPYSQSTLWNEYIASAERGVGTTLADYSHAGYHYSEQELPQVNETNYTYFDVTAYGAVAGDGKSDRSAAVAALNAAQAHSGNAVLYFPEGTFLLNEKTDFGKPQLVVTRDNVVIKGAGQHLTELIFSEPAFIGEQSHLQLTPSYPNESYWRGDSVIGNVTAAFPKGSKRVTVDSPGNFTPGMIVNFDADLDTTTAEGQEFFAPHTVPDGVKDLEDYLFELHIVDRIVGNDVYFKEPIHLDLPKMTNIKIRVINNHIRESGIQDMTISGKYREVFMHHSGSRYGEHYRMILMKDAQNCWIRNVRLKSYSDGIQLYRSIGNTVMNVNLEGNTGHNSIGGTYSYGTLFAYMRENTQTHHGFGGDHSLSNSVFLRCNQYDGLEAHCAWPRASLYDLNEGGFNPRPGGAQKFPHHGKDLTFWNWNVTKSGSNDFWPDGDNYGYFMPMVIAGLHGEPFTIDDIDTDLLAYEFIDEKITTTESLFEAQLADRLGELPAWLADQSQKFEDVSRYSNISITSLQNHGVYAKATAIDAAFAVHGKMDTGEIKTVELWVSDERSDSGFVKVADNNGWTDSLSFSVERRGTVFVKAVMLNSRNEISESEAYSIFIGDPSELQEITASDAAMLPFSTRSTIYEELEAAGGGEASSFPGNSAFDDYKNGTPFYQVEADFYVKLLETLAAFGQSTMKPALEDAVNHANAEKLIDGNTSTKVADVYASASSLMQFDLGSEQELDCLELEWASAMTTAVKLEILTSSDADAWYSAVNDEPLWESSVQRIGETLERKALPALSDTVSRIYLPHRKCRYVRLIAQKFPNNKLAEVRFYGAEPEAYAPVTVSLQPVHDAYLQGTTRYNNKDLRVENSNRVSYLQFDLNSLSGTISAMKLQLTVGADAGNGTINIAQGSHSEWTETNLTSSNKPSEEAALDQSTGALAVNQTYDYDVSDAIVKNGKVTFVVTMAAGGNDVSFASKENGGKEPKLVVTTIVTAGKPDFKLRAGYQLVSLDFVPEVKNVKTLFQPHLGKIEFIQAQNKKRLYKSDAGEWVNDIVDWDSSQAYLIKASGDIEFDIQSSDVSASPADLSKAGIYLLPTRTALNGSVQDYFSGIIDRVEWIRSIDGTSLRKVGGSWTNTIKNIESGSGVVVKLRAE